MLHRYIAAVGLGVVLLGAPAAQAAMSAAPPPSSSPTLVGATCSFGYHLDISGTCVDSMDYSRRCPPGTFAISYPNGDGFRCVPADWQRRGSWLMDFF
jgi:hypothetical protein